MAGTIAGWLAEGLRLGVDSSTNKRGDGAPGSQDWWPTLPTKTTKTPQNERVSKTHGPIDWSQFYSTVLGVSKR